jgi:hydrogenase maturation protease
MTEVGETRSRLPHSIGECVRDSTITSRVDVVVAGFGSPHGDDQVGWRVITLLGQRSGLAARLVTITDGTQLVTELGECRKLIIVDACRGGLSVGAITRLTWPDPRIRQYHSHSTHSLGVFSALQLAHQLNRIPPRVEIFGIELGSQLPLDQMSPFVEQAAAEVERAIFAELREVLDA